MPRMKTLETRMESMEVKIDSLTDTVGSLSTTVDSLSKTVRQGFAKMATKDDLEELRNMTARSFAEVAANMAGMSSNMATKKDLGELRGYVDVKFDQFVGKVRNEYDGLAKPY